MTINQALDRHLSLTQEKKSDDVEKLIRNLQELKYNGISGNAHIQNETLIRKINTATR